MQLDHIDLLNWYFHLETHCTGVLKGLDFDALFKQGFRSLLHVDLLYWMKKEKELG